jgi:hypothetical protein
LLIREAEIAAQQAAAAKLAFEKEEITVEDFISEVLDPSVKSLPQDMPSI